MKKLLSIIVPVYNAEKFLQKCVDSLLGQSYENTEIILVNDGSKDKSLELCYALSKNDKRIKVFDKPNGGAASARNLGLKEATGEYIGFCDADDFYDKDAFETLISVMEAKNLPTIECLSRVVDANYNLVESDGDSRVLEVKTADQAIRDIFLRKGNVSLATRVTRAECIKDIQIPEGRRVEDFYFTILLLLKTGSTAIYHYPFYNCFVSEGSVTRSGGGSIYFDALYFYDKSLEHLGDFKMDIEQQYYRYKMYYLLSVSLTKEERKKYKKQIERIKQDIRCEWKEIKENIHLSRKEKNILRLSKCSFTIVKNMYLLKRMISVRR